MPADSRDTKALMADALLRLREARRRIEALEAERHGELAVVGIGLRFPGPGGRDLEHPDDLWRFLAAGEDAVRPVPPERWDAERFHADDADAPGRIVARRGAFLADPWLFDPRFFGIAPREAETMDPQQRLFLETCWRALEHAGISPDALRGSRTGVFLGIATSDYSLELVRRFPYEQMVALTGTGTNHSVAAGRVAYTLGLTGPCLALNTACSSSLVALHLACESLRRGECDAALVGGVNAMLSPMTAMVFSNAHMLSRDGRCKAFDAAADGYGRGEGCGVVVLKRLADARAAGDRVQACVLGASMNQDGASGGITVPHGPSQEAVIRAALANARVEPAQVSYVEAHGTGTALGDPIELGALGAVFAAGRAAGRPLAVGSIKTNLGHTEAAAGVAGLIKVILQLGARALAPHLHLARPTPHADLERLRLFVPTALRPWPADERRIAGVSSFGFSGTNAHVVVGEAPAEEPRAPAAPAPCVLPLSARTPLALRELALAWRAFLERLPDDAGALADACATAARGRAHFPHRLALVGSTRAELGLLLARWLAGERDLAGVEQGEAHERLAAPPPTTAPAAGPADAARAYAAGQRVSWGALDPAPRRATIPGYPFERARFDCLGAPGAGPAARTGETLVFTTWTWAPKGAPLAGARGAPARCAVSGAGELAGRVRRELAARGADVEAEEAACDAAVFVWDAADLPAEAERGAALLLVLIQRLAGTPRPPRLAVVTRDGVADAALQGLARVAAIEHPELGVRRVVAASATAAQVVDELLSDDGEDEVRLQDGERSVGRLQETTPRPARDARVSGTWLVTGGLGALGRRLAERLVRRGAERVVLASRSAGAAGVPEDLDGLPVEVRACDVADARACAALVASLADLRGVVHAAGVLDDGVLAELTPARLSAVLRPKLHGAVNLHAATAARPELEHFVLVSSSAALLGSPGQANYVAANWTLEALARARRRAGLPAVAIHFGPWAGEGMAAGSATARRLEALGLRPLSSGRALDAFEALLTAGEPAAGFFHVDWRRFARAVPPGVDPRRLAPFLSALPTQAQEGEPELVSLLLEAEPEERAALLADYVVRALGRVLRMPAGTLDRRLPFAELGLDSLMGVELRNRIQGDLFVTPPITAVLTAASATSFAEALLALLQDAGLLADLEADLARDGGLLDEIEGLSDEDVERLLGGESPGSGHPRS